MLYAHERELTGEGRLRDIPFVHFRNHKIGRCEDQERCQGWQFHGDLFEPKAGWRCYRVAEFEYTALGDGYDWESNPNLSSPPEDCVKEEAR